MSAETVARSPRLQEYLQLWGNSIGQVLQQVVGVAHEFQELTADATPELAESLKENSVALQFDAAQKLAGNQGFLLSAKDAVRLSQLLLTEPEDGGSTLSDDHRDAIGELFRQFAGAAAAAVKGLAGGEVSFKWVGLNPFPGTPGAQVGLQFTSPGLASVTLISNLGSNLMAALTPAVPKALELPPPSPPPAPQVPAHDPNLKLLMDVELDVSLRFGERQMALHDILDLSAGSVVELDQHVQDPVELLVGKKVIARGEVVVVDGNYALRVMQIVSPMERIESLKN